MSEFAIMPLSDYEDACDAIRAKTGGTALIKSGDLAAEIESISGGTTITDGVIVTSRNADGYPLTIDAYCFNGIIYPKQFFSGYAAGSWGYELTSGYWSKATKLTIRNPVNSFSELCFAGFHGDISGDFSGVEVMPGIFDPGSSNGSSVFTFSGITEIDLDSIRWLSGSNFRNCASLRRVYAPKCANVYSKFDATAATATFGNCTALEDVQLGSIGYQCLLYNNKPFLGCSQSGLTIILFATGANVDTQITRIRNGATNATIIIKASEATTYNGTTYAAGDTILTSEVTA